MSIQTNQIKKNGLSIIAGDFWLKYNQHRKAENMTGQLVSDKVICARNKYPIVLKTSNVVVKPPTVKKSSNVIKFGQDMRSLEDSLRAGKFVKTDDQIFDGRSKQTIFLMIKRIREDNPDLITISGANKKAVGWMLLTKLEGALNG